MNQGLHHIPQTRLMGFLAEIYRILRPGGLFIVREHDAVDALMPMLDLAHSVFNVVGGVSLRDERNEIRAFRPLLEWRRIVESAGFVDTMLYEVEEGDPTWDEMMAFCKCDTQEAVVPLQPVTWMGSEAKEDGGASLVSGLLLRQRSWTDSAKEEAAVAAAAAAEAKGKERGRAAPAGDGDVSAVSAALSMLDKAPRMLLEVVRSVVDSLLTSLPQARETLLKQIDAMPAGKRFLGRNAIES